MLEAITRIEAYTEALDLSAFRSNTLVQDAAIRNLEVLGEAARKILRHGPNFSSAHPELPLQEAYRMRNALSHGYERVDLATVWRAIRSDRLVALLT